MTVFAVFGTEAGEFFVGSGRVAVDVPSAILAAGEVHVMPRADLLVVGAGARADEAHGIAAAALGAEIRFAAVDDATVVEAALVGVEFDGDHLGHITLGGLDLVVEDGLAGLEIVVIGEAHFAARVRAGKDAHTAVFGGGRVDREPHGHDFHGLDHRLPIMRILMPRDAFAVALGFADEVAGKERDVWTDDGLNEVHDLVGKQPLEEFRMLEMGNVHGFGADVGAEVVQNIFEAIFEAEKFGLGENRFTKDVITFAVVVFDVLGRDAVVRQGQLGGVHERMDRD
jgi:hypothetical protein